MLKELKYIYFHVVQYMFVSSYLTFSNLKFIDKTNL